MNPDVLAALREWAERIAWDRDTFPPNWIVKSNKIEVVEDG